MFSSGSFFFILPALCLFVVLLEDWTLAPGIQMSALRLSTLGTHWRVLTEVHWHPDLLRNLNCYRLIRYFDLGKRSKVSDEQQTETHFAYRGVGSADTSGCPPKHLLCISIQDHTSLSKGWLCNTLERKRQVGLWKHYTTYENSLLI